MEVTLKGTADDEGIKVIGNDETTAPINPREVSDIMKQIKDGMFDEEIFTGEEPLAKTISKRIMSLANDKPEISLTVDNEDMEYGKYKVILTIAGATGSKIIDVSKVSVNTQLGLKEAQKFNIKEIKIADSFEANEQILITKKDLVIDGNNKTISAATNMVYTDPNKSVVTVLTTSGVKIVDLTVDASKVNTPNQWNGIYALQVYDSRGIALDNITLKNADAGLLVNGSSVTVKDITTRDNEFGGIEVSKGELAAEDPELIVTGSSTHENADNTPAIWIDGKTTNGGWVKNVDGYLAVEKNNQLWFVEKAEEPVDKEAPVVKVEYLEKLASDADELKLIFRVTDDSDLSFLEIDHNLEGSLPEFKLYPDPTNPWGSSQAKQLADTYSVTSDYDAGTKTWTITFGAGTALNEIKGKGVFKVYFVVEDIHGNAFGSMSPTSSANTIEITIE